MELSANYLQEFLVNFLNQNPALVARYIEECDTSSILDTVRGYLMERDIEYALQSMLEE